MQRGFFLNVVVAEVSPVFQLLAGEDQPLFVVLGTFFVLDLSLDVHDRVARLHVQSNRLTGQSLYENLHAIATVRCRAFFRAFFCCSLGLVEFLGRIGTVPPLSSWFDPSFFSFFLVCGARCR